MDEAQAVAAATEGSGSAALGLIALFLWKLQGNIAKGIETLGAIHNAIVTQGQAALNHYSTEEKLYTSIRMDHASNEAAAKARAEYAHEMMRLRSDVDGLERREHSGPIPVTDDEQSG